MYAVFEKLLKKYGVSTYKVSQATGISTSSFTGWKQGKWNFKQDKLQKIADYFGVTIEYLMTGEETEPKETTLVPVNQNDIKFHIDSIIQSLDGKNTIYFDGQELRLNEHRKHIIKYVMKIVSEIAKDEKD